MSELKEVMNVMQVSGERIPSGYYKKSEVDKVISEKDKIIAFSKVLVLEDIKLIRHHKYKRCLAMAKWCNSEMGRETFACFRPRHTKEVWREEHKYWAKWRKIWFELAEKFKEAK